MLRNGAGAAQAIGMMAHYGEREATSTAATLEKLGMAEVAGKVRQNAHQHALPWPAKEIDATAVVTALLKGKEGHISSRKAARMRAG